MGRHVKTVQSLTTVLPFAVCARGDTAGDAVGPVAPREWGGATQATYLPPPTTTPPPSVSARDGIPAEVMNSTLYIDDVITSQGCAPSARLCFPTDLSSSLSTGTRWPRSSATWTFTTTRSRKLKASGKQSCLRSWTRCSTARKHCWMLPANGSLRKRQVSK